MCQTVYTWLLAFLINHHTHSYFQVIKKPVDLSSMNVKLEEGMYRNRNDFEADFRLMIENCYTYNPPGTFAHNEGVALEAFFEKRGLFPLLMTLQID